MPTSPRRTKKRRHLRFPVIVLLGICLVAGIGVLIGLLLRGSSSTASDTPDQAADSKSDTSVQYDQASLPDYSAFAMHKTEVNGPASLYVRTENGFEEAGTAQAGALLDIGTELEGTYLSVNDSPFYIDGSSINACDRWYRNDTRLLMQQEDLITTAPYHICNEAGTVIAEINRSDTWPVYVKPGNGDDRYGIRFMNGIAYIAASEVSAVQESGRSAEHAEASEIPVLMYHFFYSEAANESRTDGNYVEVNELDEQLKYIQENGFQACTMREIQYWMEGRASLPEKSLAITIDDADPSVHKYAMPVFMKYGLHAVNFVICGWQPAEMPYELWEMRENGMELQSHGFLTHTGGCSGMGHGGLLLCMDHDAGVEDTMRSFAYVDGGFVYCYPFGDINDNAESIVRDGGAKLAFTTEGGRINPSMDPLALPRVRVTGGNGLSAFAASIG